MVKLNAAAILIVDDSSAMRAILHDMLKRIGVPHIAQAESGEAALAQLRGSSFNVIISDWHMQPMDGLELLRRCRQISRPGFNRFMFSTSEQSWGSRTTAKTEGAEAFIVKPFDIETLRSKLEQVLAH